MLKKVIGFSLVLFFGLTFLMAQAALLKSPALNYNDTTAYPGLGSNGITQIKAQGDSLLWLGTGAGLSWVEKEHFRDSIYSYFPGFAPMPKGGISAIETGNDQVWIAAVFDSTTDQGELQTGGGLSFSEDGGHNWTKIKQPIDEVDDEYDIWNGDTIDFLPVTTPVQNTTWDIAINGDSVYIVSWAAGLRFTNDKGVSWRRIPLPADNQDSLIIGVDDLDFQINPRNNYNHMGFSVLACGDTLWVGTAKGINRGIIDGETIQWVHFSAERTAGIAGDFVVSLERQVVNGKNIIWAVTLPGPTSGESQGISYTEDGGRTWHTTLADKRGYDIATRNNEVYVATQSGLFKLSEDHQSWSEYSRISDNESGGEILTDRMYALLSDQDYLWVGTADGLARLNVADNQWSIYHESVSTDFPNQPEVYAYPNPFYPRYSNVRNDKGHVRIKFNLEQAATVWLEVYDFAMQQVYKSDKSRLTAGDRFLVWDGLRNNGETVANGTYFCKLNIKDDSGSRSHWTKLIIMK
ncbi:MAG: hypothetical protein K9N00_01390 [Candidatus Marinimicrobia bacterium]|nr:hypothetical protein [Candidatus Neomarinimicrobiota bacterium]